MLYFLLLLGVTGFCVAAEQPGLWVLIVGGIAIHAALVKTGRFRPMPRLLANILTLAALAYIILQLRANTTTPIVTIGQFLALIHLVKLYEVRANRDYAQLLVVSLLLMVAAAISTASLVFGITLFAYLFVSLYCCLLFHLKVETDAARALLHLPEDQVNPTQLRQDQRYLSSSMRRLTGLVSLVSIVMAVIVFLFFPRGAGEGMLARRFISADRVLTGFSDHVSFQDVARIGHNESKVAEVKLLKNDLPVDGTQALWLRGLTLDTYTGDLTGFPKGDALPWEWLRSADEDQPDYDLSDSTPQPLVDRPDTTTTYTQDITLEPTGTQTLFAMRGAILIWSANDLHIKYHRSDGVLTTMDPMNQAGEVHYTVVSNGVLPRGGPVRYVSRSRIDPQILAFARRPEVSGTDESGRPLVDLLGTPDAPADINFRIAASIEAYLRKNFTYTLDLTDAADLIRGKDPMVAFLYDLKRGHCEYFAGAMTLMCQSLGIPARVVVGFRSDEFNPLGHFYVVKQSHAHAWVEVLTNDGWWTFDPTSSQTASISQPTGLLAKLGDLFDYLEFQWGANVVAYNQTNRQNLLDTVNNFMNKTAESGGQPLASLDRLIAAMQPFFKAFGAFIISPTLIGGLMWVLGLTIVTLIGWFMYTNARLRRRARRIGLGKLPTGRRVQLARQLGFYDDLLHLLERHKIVSPPHLTPQEFSDSLSFLPHEAYDSIRRLTQLFYRIRFGETELSSPQRRRLANVISRLDRLMSDPSSLLMQ